MRKEKIIKCILNAMEHYLYNDTRENLYILINKEDYKSSVIYYDNELIPDKLIEVIKHDELLEFDLSRSKDILESIMLHGIIRQYRGLQNNSIIQASSCIMDGGFFYRGLSHIKKENKIGGIICLDEENLTKGIIIIIVVTMTKTTITGMDLLSHTLTVRHQ